MTHYDRIKYGTLHFVDRIVRLCARVVEISPGLQMKDGNDKQYH